MTPAEQIALWSDRPRDMAATGLKYAQNIYDHERYCGAANNAPTSIRDTIYRQERDQQTQSLAG
ncbi:MAG TPA: hypothetical protein VFU22_10770 [Roseiflexaceae bacterium]|nr:hypothetical protein [Roseiflexaceae bacterium]